ncbi:MAG: hypothetical protein ACREUL_05625 [Steroidobacteraceae bacterium]
MIASSTANESRDWARKPLAFMLWWGLPILGGISSSFLGLSLASAAFLWAGAFAWMGTGCVLNARRCARRHCFISGPALLLGAIAAALVGFGIVSAPHALEDIVNATVISVALSCLPEWFSGRYYTLRS